MQLAGFVTVPAAHGLRRGACVSLMKMAGSCGWGTSAPLADGSGVVS